MSSCISAATAASVSSSTLFSTIWPLLEARVSTAARICCFTRLEAVCAAEEEEGLPEAIHFRLQVEQDGRAEVAPTASVPVVAERGERRAGPPSDALPLLLPPVVVVVLVPDCSDFPPHLHHHRKRKLLQPLRLLLASPALPLIGCRAGRRPPPQQPSDRAPRCCPCRRLPPPSLTSSSSSCGGSHGQPQRSELHLRKLLAAISAICRRRRLAENALVELNDRGFVVAGGRLSGVGGVGGE
ncbi:hypothetical protein TYRP_021807 [Tyrophagus putrescentiae]|nr:hypothetical protein TYRP_021807 [Tyrophagus putrescentiae]